MSQRKEPFIHPFTYFLVQDGLSSIFDSVKMNDLGGALEKLYWLTGFLDKKMQIELKENIEEMENFHSNYGSFNRIEFRKIFTKIMRALHEEGYFLAAKRGPTTRPTEMKDMKMRLEKARYAKSKS